MGIFSTSSPFDDIIVKATLETNTKEDWALILDICDRVSTSSTAPKECLRSIVKRLNHQDPHVVVQAITLMDACVSNCGLAFHLEIASREFEQEFRKLISKPLEKTLHDKLLNCLQKWADNEFKSDPQLDLIPSLVGKLKQQGFDFPSDSPHKTKKSGGSHHHHHHRREATSSGAPVAQEDADLAKAIELSLKEAQGGTGTQSKSLYPQASSLASGGVGSSSLPGSEEKESRKVRALYDFEAAEENELTFYAGEIVFVSDDSDPNWWQGSNQRGKGLFPANFVSADLSAETPKFEIQAKKAVQFAEDVEVQSVTTEPEVVEIDEAKVDRVLNMLHDADPTGEVEDPPELTGLEDQVNQMGPLIDQELEKIDKRHAQLTRLGGELVEALNMYHNLMREPSMAMNPTSMPYNMKMGMGGMNPGISAPTSFPMGGPMPYSGFPSYDANVPYSMMRPPQLPQTSNGTGYSPGPYQQPQHPNGMQQQQMGSQHHIQNSSDIPNGQLGGLHQQINPNQPTSMTGPGNQVPMGPQVPPFSQGMMMPPHSGQNNMGMPGSGYAHAPNVTSQHQMMPQQMPASQGGPGPQQFGQPPQVYHHPQSPPPNAPSM